MAKRGCGEKNIEKLAYGEGDEADETDKANVSKDFLVIPDDEMSNDCSHHSCDQQASARKENGRRMIGKKEGKDDANTTKYFDQGNRANDARTEIGYPTHSFGEHFDGLEKANASAEGKDQNEDDLSG